MIIRASHIFKKLSRRESRWAQCLTRFDFLISYCPRVKQGNADALSRRSYLAPRPGEPAFGPQKQVLLRHDRLRLLATHVFESRTNSNLLQTIRTEIQTDSFRSYCYGSPFVCRVQIITFRL